MKAKEQTQQQIERALRKIAAKYPQGAGDAPLTDIHLQVKQESGELLAFDDNDKELNRCVIEEWIENKDEKFYEDVQLVLRKCISEMKGTLENLGILKPYSFTLMDDDRETVADLYLVDDETLILDDELMKGLGEELDLFLKELLKK